MRTPIRFAECPFAARPLSRVRFGTLAAANAASVMALYWNQALVNDLAATFPEARFLSLVSAMTLAGYAAGVGLIAFGPAALGRLSIGRHLGFLAIALASAGSAPNVPTLAIISFFVGCGASAAPRLLARAAHLVESAVAGTAIGQVICGSLIAVLGVRLLGEDLARVLGWRSIFFTAAAIVASLSLLASGTRATHDLQGLTAAAPGTVRALWRSCPLLRRAAAQQAALFAAFNASWMTVLVELPPQERPLVVIGGCCSGLIAALLAGRSSDKFGQHGVVKAGAAAILIAASLLLPAAYSTPSGVSRTLLLVAGMALVDAGLQVALVANQTRVQALEPLARTQLAATLTVCGALGGAIGAGAGYWLWQTFGWPAAIGFVAAAGYAGFSCSVFTAAVRLRFSQASSAAGNAKQPSRMACRSDQHRQPQQAISIHEDIGPRDPHSQHAGWFLFPDVRGGQARHGMTRIVREKTPTQGV